MPIKTKTKQTLDVKTVDTPSDLATVNDSQLGLFDYSSLDANTAKLAKESAIEIKAREKAIWENIIEIGNRLIEVKNALPHGQFGQWIDKEFDWSEDTAQKYMKISQELEQYTENSRFFPKGKDALYRLASGLSKVDEETKEQILEDVKQQTEEKGKALTEKEIKELTKPYLEQIEALKKEKEQLSLTLENTETRIDNVKSFMQSQLDTKENELKKAKETLENQNKQIKELNSLSSQLEKRQKDLAEKEADLNKIIDGEVTTKVDKETNLALADINKEKDKLMKDQQKIKKELEAIQAEKDRFTRANKWVELMTEYNLEFAKMCDRLKYISTELNQVPKFEDLGELSEQMQKSAQLQMNKFSDNLDEFGKFNNRIIMGISRIDKNPLKAYEVTAEVIDD